MRNVTYTFEEFKEIYFEDFDGFMPTYAFYEDGALNIEMIVNWRLLDGKIRVAEIRTSNPEHITQINEYLAKCGEWWKEELIKRSNNILESFTEENKTNEPAR